MTTNDLCKMIEVLRRNAPRAIRAVEETVCDMMDGGADPEAVDAAVEAAMFDNLLADVFALVTPHPDGQYRQRTCRGCAAHEHERTV